MIRIFTAVLLVVAAVACSDDSAAPSDSGSPVDVSTSRIGRGGGEVELDDGAMVVVPRGALVSERLIGVEVVPLSGLPELPGDFQAASQGAYAFLPHGIQFMQPATLSVPFTSAKLQKRLFKLESDSDPDWEGVDEVDWQRTAAVIQVSSFSIYLVAEPKDGPPISCDEPLLGCDGECVDTNSDDRHCGSCRFRCRDATCTGGVCVANEPMDGGAPDTGPPADCNVDGDCDDGNYCNGPETCPSGTCVAGTAISCDDSDPSTMDSCDEPNDLCVNTPIDDGGV